MGSRTGRSLLRWGPAQIRAEVTPRTPNPRPFPKPQALSRRFGSSQVSPGLAGPDGASDKSRSQTGPNPEPHNRDPFSQITARFATGPEGASDTSRRNSQNPKDPLADNSQVSPGFAGAPEAASDKNRSHTQTPKTRPFSQITDKCRQEEPRSPRQTPPSKILLRTQNPKQTGSQLDKVPERRSPEACPHQRQPWPQILREYLLIQNQTLAS